MSKHWDIFEHIFFCVPKEKLHKWAYNVQENLKWLKSEWYGHFNSRFESSDHMVILDHIYSYP